ncbi:ScbA/BarX family gamma-butyrolactone biosynthesis protein [Allostreptomyces psammosilenae]|uniref:A-factor biosynthesis hotdog domain-containing protein n=1 Tax=Allostreptomyces psammosilenae TaxID=1892865 RepID=A0A852ZRG2_9ACTN|nr:ScbA/BarX family gamma-butyrolactone biosynthesis protein [Allostreptomyces psammosilenae]NYI04067.1 hypothetical protein [Allostreptomyces psammosilenae]
MTTTRDTPAAAPEPPPPSFTRTIERQLVHRAAVSEVFVTDLLPFDGTRYLAGAQLPLAHGYYGDHPRRPAGYDFLLLLEAARQASTAAGHQGLGIPMDCAFLVNSWSIRLDGGTPPPVGARPGELHLRGDGRRVQARGGRLRGAVFDVDLGMAGRPVGRVHIDTSVTSGEDYHKLRFLQRGSTPPLTEQLRGRLRSRPADAAAVGRANPVNVVLGEPAHTGEETSAQVEPRYDNSALFDHTYDHVPAMVLCEAARQLAHLGGVPVGTAVTGCQARFLRFAELDSALVATGRPGVNPGEAAPDAYHVTFRQDGADIARIDLTFERTATTGARPDPAQTTDRKARS